MEPQTSPPNFSVLIRSFNSAKTLDRLLSRLDQIEGDEVIVVDSGSTDATLEITKRHGARIIIAEGPFNYSKSLNLGFKAARNDWVLVLSSHCIPVGTDLLATYRREAVLLPEDVPVAYGPSTISGKSEPSLDKECTTLHSGRIPPGCGNGNALYRFSAWEELPFDESKRTAEDVIWLSAMLERGRRVAYVPKAAGLNINQQSLRYMFRKGHSDSRTLRLPTHRPMPLFHFAGALKNLTKQWLKREINLGNYLRYGAHTFGQFFGSREPEDNTPSGSSLCL